MDPKAKEKQKPFVHIKYGTIAYFSDKNIELMGGLSGMEKNGWKPASDTLDDQPLPEVADLINNGKKKVIHPDEAEDDYPKPQVENPVVVKNEIKAIAKPKVTKKPKRK